MAAAFLSRRLIKFQSLQNPNPKPLPLLKPIPFLKPFSSTPDPNPNPNPSPSPSPYDSFKHQEIEGPTVAPDDSPLANETRQTLTSLRKSIHNLSSSLALLSFAHLGLGAYATYSPAPSLLMVQSVAAFAFPFSAAFLMRRTLKPLGFFQKMEEQGRLQVLTLSMQAAKGVKVLFVRLRVATVCCLVVISAGSVVAILLR